MSGRALPVGVYDIALAGGPPAPNRLPATPAGEASGKVLRAAGVSSLEAQAFHLAPVSDGEAVVVPPAPEDAGAFLGEARAVALVERTRHQCPYPLWPDDAGPEHAAYGRVCGAPRAVKGEVRQAYCAHHAKLCGGSRAETDKARRITEAVVKTARMRGVA